MKEKKKKITRPFPRFSLFNMNNLHPLHLHEILILIADHLDIRSLHASVHVNHAWHTSFAPHLWHSARLTFRGPNLTHPLANHIRHLTLDNTSVSVWPEPRFLPVLSRLTSLTFNVVDPYLSYRVTPWPFLEALINNQANTGTLSLIDLGHSRGTPGFWAALARCQSLKTLRLRDTNLHHEIVPVPCLLKVCSTVETIVFEDVSISRYGMTRRSFNGPLMRLKHLKLRGMWLRNDDDDSDGDNGLSTVPWTCSPNLESLSVVEGPEGSEEAPGPLLYLDVITAEIRAALAANREGRRFYACPRGSKDNDDDDDDAAHEQYQRLVPARKLHTLETVSHTIQDHDLAFLLDHVERPMQVLCVPTSKAGPLTIKALARHYAHLTKLNVRHTNISSIDVTNISSPHVLAFLQCCPQLRSLGATGLLGQDVLASSDTPWACTRLQRLSIDILIDDWSVYQEQAQAVFRKLGELRQLEFLDLQSERERDDLPHNFAWLKFQRAHGMDHLAGLTKMREIRAQEEAYKGLDVGDAEWMVEHWPEMMVVGVGVDGCAGDVFRKVRDVFEARGVSTVETKASLEI